MSQCLNPSCLRNNPPNSKFCQKCGDKLLLVERYRAIKILGQGGFGRTFLAVDELKPSQPQCVIKQLLPQAQGTSNASKAAELFAQEAEQLEKLGKHSQIPELLAYFTQNERQYLVQELIDGDNLAQELEEKGAYNEAQIRELLRDMLTVLQFVHSNNVIHRDIKPENIIRRRRDGKLVLVDFGAAKVEVNPNLSVTGTVIGSPEYTAPEQAGGKAKFASDLYSLGVTCIHLLTQIRPRDLYDHGEGDWVWRDYLTDNPVSDELGEVLNKLIEGATKRRYKEIKDVLEALNGKSPPQPPITPQNPIQQQSRTQKLFPQQQPGVHLKKFQFEVVTVSLIKEVKKEVKKQVQKKLFRKDVVTDVVTDVVSYNLNYQHKSGEAEYFTVELPYKYTQKRVTLDMVKIPGRTFRMGAISPFYMSKYPLTQAQWEAVMGTNPSHFKGENCPVEWVSWEDAMKFCQTLSTNTEIDFNLPSEAQWEYACRAGTTTPFHFGDTLTDKLANYDATSTYAYEPKGEYRRETTPVGSFPPNAFGLYDMHGNVWEWCLDYWHSNYDGAPRDGSAWTSGGNSDRRLLRGGSWYHNARFCSAANRSYNPPGVCNKDIGFRVVCVSLNS